MKVVQVDMRCRIRKPNVGRGLTYPIILNREECEKGTQRGVRLQTGEWVLIEDLISYGEAIEDEVLLSLQTDFLFTTYTDKQFTCVLGKYVIVCVGLLTSPWCTLRDDMGAVSSTDVITSIGYTVIKYAKDVFRMIVTLRNSEGVEFFRVVEFTSSFHEKPVFVTMGKNTIPYTHGSKMRLTSSLVHDTKASPALRPQKQFTRKKRNSGYMRRR